MPLKKKQKLEAKVGKIGFLRPSDPKNLTKHKK